MNSTKEGKIHLFGMTRDELQEVAKECGLPKFAIQQITDWLYKKNILEIEDMTNISLKNREILSVKYDVGRYPPMENQRSKDGTVKYLFATKNNKFVESVMIPEQVRDRYTLCVSSQVGCKMNCIFCMTGKQGFNGDLTANEMLNQLFSVEEAEKLTNAVFMGMGEPLDNYEELRKTLEIMTSDYGMAWSPKRITVSTTGVTPKLERLIEETDVHIAISIHSPISEQRQTLMPVEKAYPIDGIIKLLHQHDWSKQRRLSFEYIMFDGYNDTPVHARELANMLKGLDCRINLIRYHAIPNVDLKTSSDPKMEDFKNHLVQRGIIATIRSSRGEDIFAACGMLSTEKEMQDKN